MIKGAIFDMDGTITDTERMYRDAWLKLTIQYGQNPIIDFEKEISGSNDQEAINILTHYYPTIDGEQFLIDCVNMVKKELEKHVPIKEGTREILSFFKSKGIKIAIASSNSHELIMENMERSNLAEFFDIIVGGDEISHSKPHPEIFQLAASKLGLATEECYIFEDSLNGLKAGLAAGGKVIMMIDLIEPDDQVAPQCAGIYRNFTEAIEDLQREIVQS